MRVLYVTNGLRYGGAERIVEALAEGVAARGGAVEVVATTRDGPIGEALRRKGIATHVLGIRSPIDLRVLQTLRKIVDRFSPDVVHSHLAVADIASAFSRPKSPLITTVHNSGVELDRLKRLLWYGALGRFDRILAVGETVKRSLPIDLRADVVHPSLISLDDPLLSRDEARRKLGVKSDEKLVLAIGRLAPIKGFDVLAEAVKHVKNTARFVVIGEGPEEATLRSTKLELAGAKEDAAALVPAADLVVCPSRSEGFPQVPLHALAAGVPIVATHAGGLPDVVKDGETGVLVPPEDPRALALVIDALLDDPARREKLGKNGPEYLVRAGLTKAAMIDRTFDAYREMGINLT